MTTASHENRYTGESVSSSGISQEGWAEESSQELSQRFSGNTPLQVGNNPTATVIEKTTEVAEKVVDTTMEVAKTVDKVISNKTVGDVVSGGGLASQMVETAATSAKKEVISETRRKSRILHRNKIKTKLSGAWRKTVTALSKIKNIAKWTGRIFGGLDIISNSVNVWKVFRNKNSNIKDKFNAAGKLIVSAISVAFRATPIGFIGSFALSAISNIIFK